MLSLRSNCRVEDYDTTDNFAVPDGSESSNLTNLCLPEAVLWIPKSPEERCGRCTILLFKEHWMQAFGASVSDSWDGV